MLRGIDILEMVSTKSFHRSPMLMMCYITFLFQYYCLFVYLFSYHKIQRDYLGGIIIGRIFASEIWSPAYFQEGLFLEGFIIGIFTVFICLFVCLFIHLCPNSTFTTDLSLYQA